MTFDRREFRNALGCFPTGVTIVTVLGPNEHDIGVTVNSFNSVSMEPPLILWSLDRSAYSLPIFLATSHFAVNVLSSDQVHLSNQFAGAKGDKWSNVDFERWSGGSAIIKGCVANFDCEKIYAYDGGDHVIFVGRVIEMKHDPHGAPLLFHQGRYKVVGDVLP